MTKEAENALYLRALDQWGYEVQMDMAAEECAGLIVAINHSKRGRAADLAGEIADVEIMTGQLRLMIGAEAVEQAKAQNLERLLATLDELNDSVFEVIR
jgi:hypothetical protein